MGRSEKLFEEAARYIPGGVNSPVRAFGSVGAVPRFIERANQAYIYDADGVEYIDYVCSWGPMILGHNHPAVHENAAKACQKGFSFGAATEIEVKMAKLICDLVPFVEMVRMVNSGTEAVMSAIRLARGYTGRDKIVKFTGCYHGHSDALLVKAGSGVMTAGVPDSSGVTKGCTQDTLLAEYNDLESVKSLFAAHGEEIAAIIVEPVAANMGVVLPGEGFQEGLRSLCDTYGSLLIFDEVITGFRLSIGGAAEYFNIMPDLATYGKIIGGGMPVGAYGGRREIMEHIAPRGTVYQAGTLSGNPVAMWAGYTQLTLLRDNPSYYEKLKQSGEKLYDGIKERFAQAGIPCQMNHIGSLGCLYFTEQPVVDYETAKTADTERFSDYFKWMLQKGIYLAPSQFEAMFLSVAHGDGEIDKTFCAVESYVKR